MTRPAHVRLRRLLSSDVFRTAAIVAIAISASSCHRPAPAAMELDWTSVAGDSRPTAGRLSSALPYRPAGGRSAGGSLHRDGARARLEQRLERTREPHDLHALAVLDILSQRPEAASALLEEVIDRDPSNYRYWNDLGVAHLARAEADASDGRSLARALDAFLTAADRNPNAAEPLFNLTVCLERLGLSARARAALTRLFSVERDPQWRREVELRQSRLAHDSAGDWTAPHETLHRAADAGREAHGLAARFPQAVRECVEDHLLKDWGSAVAAGDANGARTRLSTIAVLATELEVATKDSFLKDVVRELSDASRAARLAPAYVKFANSRALYEAGRYEPAAANLTQADRIFTRERSVFTLRNRLELSTMAYQARDVPRARAIVESILAAADRRHRTVVARAEWMHGITLMQSSSLEPALDAYERAYREYGALGEQENAAAVANAACDSLRILGERGPGWSRLTNRVLAALPSTRSARRRYVALLNASLYASADGLDRAALEFQNASLDAARERGVPNTIVEALIRRAGLLVKRRAWEAARVDLDDARQRLAAVSSETSRRYQDAWLRSVEGELLADTAPDRGVPVIERAAADMKSAEPAEVPRLLLIGARAARALGRQADAEEILRNGIGTFERRWALLGRDDARTSYLDEGWDLYRGLAQLEAEASHAPGRAFTTLERGKAIALAKLRAGTLDAQDTTIEDLQRVTPPHAATLYFSVGDRSVLVWSITRTTARFAVRPFDRSAIVRRVGAYRLLLESRRGSAELAQLSRALFAGLVAGTLEGIPESLTTLAIVPDDVLNAVPFATLTNPSTSRSLIDDMTVIVSPSAKELIAASRRLQRERPRGDVRILSVGNSAGSADQRLPRLPEAETEAAAVASHYPHGTILTGGNATFDRVRSSSIGAEVLHFAGHAVANDTWPERSFLLLAPDSAHVDGRITTSDISQWPLRQLRLAVLSGCRTASGAVSRGEGILGLVRPFLAAGVPSVIGASWDVDDHATRVLLSEFHTAYARTRDAPWSLRAAQRALASSTDPRLRDPGTWGGFVAISGFVPADPARP